MNGKIRISKVTDSTKDEDFIRITLQDTTSKIQFLTVDVSLDDFARALFGIENTPCELTFNNLKAIGKTKEVKMFEVQTDEMWVLPTERLEFLARDGWQIQLSSKLNSRNYRLNSADSQYKFTASVMFERFV
ncbi:MAG: hypothetical protein EKK57_07840 [Proteobacteria bacterium]|nr:MAG: hypothetical protein EKK57_07840 [Pseudomonadota bacterium]